MSRAQLLSVADCPNAKIALWSGAVRSGKTFISLFAFLFAVLRAPKTGVIIIVGRTLDTINGNLFSLLTNPEIFGPLTKYIKYTPGAKTASILGRTVHLYGANDASSETKIRGLTVSLAYVDEATIIPEGFWNMLVTRLSVDGARLLATTNPGSKSHWLRKGWILDAAEKNLVHFAFTMDDNPSLSESFKNDMKASYAGVFYQRFIQGLWTNAEGAVYPMWNEDKHLIKHEDLPPIKRTLAVGMDYGTTNTTAALLLGLTDEPQPRLVFIDEWHYSSSEHHGETIPDVELSRRFREWLHSKHGPENIYVPYPEFVFLDPSAASMRAQLHSDNLTSWAADNTVLDGIANIANLLSQDKLIVTDRCKTFLAEVTEYEWDAKASEEGKDEVVKRDDHAMDAARYAVRSSIGSWQYEVYGLAA
ncbi:PBSX family phage terminase large subunit [Leucobacter viscericola]|uniref:PBSX family phage terminase large subunit n=1 Tax=Leucobacter viscericola TaxID=2714935 RepID=A0A6G7XHS8_9MICO|nr:PBSX family phage terminase large subunit [Leucobacter viscericola]QIK64160.1 PBSX family phage terminase large subunit [Leucobacter viscericola]